MTKKLALPRMTAQTTGTITPRFLLRVGGLPINGVHQLRFEQAMHWQEHLLSLESQLLQQKGHLVDILHEAVNTYREEQKIRRALINLKRNIFNMQISHGTQEARTLGQLLAEDERRALLQWLDLWDEYQLQLSLGPKIVEQELRQKRVLLKELITTEDFRKGVLLSSPILHQAVEGYLASDHQHLKREQRTVERSLLEYLFRTACKTSPFSTFTPVSIGMLDGEGEPSPHDIELSIGGTEKQSFTRLNMIVLSRLSAQILASLEIRNALRVRVTNGWRRLANTIEYVRRKPVSDTTDPDVSLPLDFIQEHVIQLPMGSLMRSLLTVMGDGHEEKFADVVQHLSASDPHHRTGAVVEEYLQHLLRLGFLIVPALQVNIHHHRPLDAFCQKLHTIGTPQTDLLADQLGTITILVDRYAGASLLERAELLGEIKHILHQCITIVGTPQNSMILPKTLLYEDTTLSPQRLAIHEEQWAELFAELQELQHILPIFDARQWQRILTRGYFQARYGVGARCDDFFSFADMLNVEFLRPLQRDANDLQIFDGESNFKGRPDYFQQPEVQALNRARKLAAEQIRAAYQAAEPGSKELALEDDFIRTIAPLVPEACKDLASSTFFSQFARVNDSPLLILNQIYPGLTLMFSRFAYCFAEDQQIAIVSTLRSVLQQLQPADAVFAELKGGYDATNLNLHPAVTAYELVCPGELSARPAEEQIPIEDLYIQDNAKAGRLSLYSRRLGKEVIPLYLGFLTPMLLPEIQQILLNFSYLTAPSLDLWSGTKIAPADTALMYYPRLRYKHLVLQRASWRMQANCFPQREGGQSDADFFLAVTRWRKKHALPAKVFFTPTSATRANAGPEEGDEAQTGTGYQPSKPLYVDFENLFSLLVLEAMLRKANSTFLITEMLPQPEHLWFRHNDLAYVSEFVFEVSRRRDDDEKSVD